MFQVLYTTRSELNRKKHHMHNAYHTVYICIILYLHRPFLKKKFIIFIFLLSQEVEGAGNRTKDIAETSIEVNTNRRQCYYQQSILHLNYLIKNQY